MGKLSDAADRLLGQEMFQILSRANEIEREGKQILHFELGDPNFDTPKNIINAVYDSLKKGETHYINSMGLLELRVAAADVTTRSRGFRPDLEQILVTPGANVQIYYTLACTVNPGEEVIIPDPCFVSYFSIINFIGAKAVRVPLYEKNEFRLNPEDVKKAITDETRTIIINSPSNPTGAVMTEEEMEKIYKIAEENDLWLLSDEIYARMIYEEGFHSPSKYDYCKERVVIINGFSKSFAMTGWRVGVVTGPSKLIKKMGLLLETTTSCVSPFIQRACVEALKGNQKPIFDMVEEYKRRRDVMVEGLNTLPGVSCLKPGGAFYVFPNIQKTGLNSREFADFMLNEAGVSLAPGTIFGKYGEGYVRMSYANSIENIENGIERMNYALRNK